MTLCLMTLNLNYREPKHGTWDRRCALIADAIARADADVVALQAVERGEGESQANELASMLRYNYVEFVAAMGEGRRARGSAYIARRPISALNAHRFSHRGDHEDRDERLLLKTRVHARHGTLDAYNAHFSWVPTQAQDNAREALTLCSADAGIFLGDLNSEPKSETLATLRRGGWTDVWESLRPGDPGYTFEADRPTMRIDYVLANPPALERVRAIEHVRVNTAESPRLSNHLGLVVTLSDA